MTSQFDFGKTLEAAVTMLRQAGGTLSRVQLLKLLYLADRECLLRYGHTITGSSILAYSKGPVLQEVYELMRDKHNENHELWNQYIGESPQHQVRARSSVENWNCLQYEMQIVQEVSKHYAGWDEQRLSNYTHTLPEWDDARIPSKSEITQEIILTANHKEDLLEEHEAFIARQKEKTDLFGDFVVVE